MAEGMSVSAEAGKFFCGFISQAIVEFFNLRSSEKNKLDILQIESWQPIIAMLDYLKAIHNLSQSYLLSIQYMLFGDEANPINNSDTPLGSIQKKWETHYHDNFYAKFIDPFINKRKTLIETIEKNDEGIDDLKKASKLCKAISEELNGFQGSSSKAHKNICEFISNLEEISNNIKEGNIGRFELWRGQVKLYAKDSVRHSDDSIVRIIPILSYLYEEALR